MGGRKHRGRRQSDSSGGVWVAAAADGRAARLLLKRDALQHVAVAAAQHEWVVDSRRRDGRPGHEEHEGRRRGRSRRIGIGRRLRRILRAHRAQERARRVSLTGVELTAGLL